MRRYAFECTIIHAIWLILIFGFTDGFHVPFSTWLESFYQWDARWYGSIAQDGHGFLPQTYAFPPLYGWIVGGLTDFAHFIVTLFSNEPRWIVIFYGVALAIGVTTFAIANMIFVVLSEKRWGLDRRRLWLVAIANPLGYFALTAYSDMFFYALMMLTLLAVTWTSPRRQAWSLRPLSAKESRYAHAGLAALLFLSPWVRLTGFAYAAWLLLKRKEVVATFLALGGFIAYNWLRTDDPFFFLSIQRAFQMPEGNFLTGLMTMTRVLTGMFSEDPLPGENVHLYALNFGVLPLLSFALSLGLIVWLFVRREFEWALAVLAITALSHNQAFWRSTVRYALPLYPMFFWMLLTAGKTGQPTRVRKLATQITFAGAIVMALTIQLFYARMFREGWWAF